jgi:enoyl-CoA hydratase
MPETDLDVAIADNVAILTLNRPAARNALSHSLRAELRSAIGDLDADPGIHAMVLTGTDPAFCAGVDLKEFNEPGRTSDLTGRGEPFFGCTTPVIGAINGPAYTGGLELALACHLRVASERAVFADTHARLGFTPGRGLTVLLTDAVGSARARQLALTGEPIDATTAYDWGLVNEVVSHEQLLERATHIARSIAAQSPQAVRRLSQTFEEQAAARQAASWTIEANGFLGAAPRP